jgi:glycosyltransferase involved in cell wall biosynthesis
MSTVVIDVRANHDTGVSRFGLSSLAAAVPLLTQAGWRPIVVAQAHQMDRARQAVRGFDATVLCCPDEQTGFVRRSPWLHRLLASGDVDLYFTSHYTLDRHCPVPYVFTIHDLTRIRFPEFSYTDVTFVKKFGRAELELISDELAALTGTTTARSGQPVFPRYFRAVTEHLAERAEGIVTVSQTVADDIVGILGIDREQVRVVPCIVDTAVFRRQPPPAVDRVRRSLRLAGPYLLFVGLTHPNKRTGWLVEQLLANRHRLPTGARLVAVGGHAELTPEITNAVSAHRAADFVVYTGRVSDADLAALYSGASALVTASISEGSNLPAQEAMACGCPVIATDIPTHRETLQDAAALYPAHRGDELADLAARALSGWPIGDVRAYRPPRTDEVGAALSDALMTAGQPAFTLR